MKGRFCCGLIAVVLGGSMILPGLVVAADSNQGVESMRVADEVELQASEGSSASVTVRASSYVVRVDGFNGTDDMNRDYYEFIQANLGSAAAAKARTRTSLSGRHIAISEDRTVEIDVHCLGPVGEK